MLLFIPSQVPRSAGATTFSAFEYVGKLGSTYLLYFYLRSDLGGVLSLAGEPGAGAAAGAGLEGGVDPAAFGASDGGGAEAAPPYSGGYATVGASGFNSSYQK